MEKTEVMRKELRKQLKDKKRIVIKIGSSSITHRGDRSTEPDKARGAGA